MLLVLLIVLAVWFLISALIALAFGRVVSITEKRWP